MRCELLLPCPCCGSRAENQWHENNFGEDKVHIFCNNWKCLLGTKDYDEEIYAIEAWNRRIK